MSAVDESWQIAAQAGRKTTIDALAERLRRRMERGDSEKNWMALLIGGLTGIAAMMGAATSPEKAALMEEITLAHVRGAIRGGDGPVNADGSVFISKKPQAGG
jgi:hypothetical protein